MAHRHPALLSLALAVRGALAPAPPSCVLCQFTSFSSEVEVSPEAGSGGGVVRRRESAELPRKEQRLGRGKALGPQPDWEQRPHPGQWRDTPRVSAATWVGTWLRAEESLAVETLATVCGQLTAAQTLHIDPSHLILPSSALNQILQPRSCSSGKTPPQVLRRPQIRFTTQIQLLFPGVKCSVLPPPQKSH